MVQVNNNGRISNFITKMTKADAKAPVIALEAAVVGGRTLQAYKRGGVDESRERFLEEITGTIVWLWGVEVLNSLGDKLLGKVLKSNNTKFDVGTDKVLRTPFDNFMKKVAPKNLTPTKVAMYKGLKVASSILIANLFIGFVEHHINHALTNKLRHERKELQNKNNHKESLNVISNSDNSLDKKESKDLSFKGALGAMNVFTNAIENTNTGKLLSTDIGIAGGRMYNARTNEERREIGIRDIGSIYFYMWAQGHVRNVMNFLESGHWTRLNPESANLLTGHLEEFISKNGNEMSVEDFKKAFLGNEENVKLPDNINFEKGELSFLDKFMNNFKSNKKEPLQVAKISDLEKIITDEKLMTRLKEMSKLQPERLGESVITKQQIIDAINVAEINNPELLDKAFSQMTNGAHKEEFQFVSNESLYNLKAEMKNYIKGLCKAAKNGKINKNLINNYKDKNVKLNGLNFVAGFAVAAAFLSTFIPKIQYYVTRKTTGVDAFPGTYDYANHKEVDA